MNMLRVRVFRRNSWSGADLESSCNKEAADLVPPRGGTQVAALRA